MEYSSPPHVGKDTDLSLPNQRNKPEPHRSSHTTITTNTRQANVLFVFRIATLAITLIAALRVLVCPKPLSEVELSFLKWTLGIAAVLLGVIAAISRRLQRQIRAEAEEDSVEE
jgi:hypothetical protein